MPTVCVTQTVEIMKLITVVHNVTYSVKMKELTDLTTVIAYRCYSLICLAANDC